MNNDIHSVRREPLEKKAYSFGTIPGGEMPYISNRLLFINHRLKRAWSMYVTSRYPDVHHFRARVTKEVDYKDAIQTN